MLRSAITEITERSPVEEHLSRLQELGQRLNHGIKPVESQEPLESYTCAVHAFHLVANPTYVEVASYGLRLTFAGKDFVEFLMRNGTLQPIEEDSAQQGDIVVYLDGINFCHVARLISPGRALSKWGRGLLVEHGLWEVPTSYGMRIEYFANLSPDASFAAFIQYAESQGFNFD
jgi:hypothetical protein